MAGGDGATVGAAGERCGGNGDAEKRNELACSSLGESKNLLAYQNAVMAMLTAVVNFMMAVFLRMY